MNSPRSLFQKVCKEEAKKLALTVNEAWFEKAVTYSLAELSSRGISDERLQGANLFIETLTTLADEEKPIEGPPDKHLASYG